MPRKSLNLPPTAYPVIGYLWRYARVFLAAFLAQVAVDIVVVNDIDTFRSILVSAFAASVATLFKHLRENWKKDIVKLFPL